MIPMRNGRRGGLAQPGEPGSSQRVGLLVTKVKRNCRDLERCLASLSSFLWFCTSCQGCCLYHVGISKSRGGLHTLGKIAASIHLLHHGRIRECGDTATTPRSNTSQRTRGSCKHMLSSDTRRVKCTWIEFLFVHRSSFIQMGPQSCSCKSRVPIMLRIEFRLLSKPMIYLEDARSH